MNLGNLSGRKFFLTENLVFQGLLLAAGLLCIAGEITSWAGLAVLAIIFLAQRKFLAGKMEAGNMGDAGITSFFFLSSYYIFSLAVLYYIFGLNKIVLSLWLAAGLAPLFYGSIKEEKAAFRHSLKTAAGGAVNHFKNLALDRPAALALAAMLFLSAYFFGNPIKNGSPTPWINAHWFAFVLFFGLSFFLIKRTLEKKNNDLVNLVFLFSVIGLVGLKYPYAYGFDTMLHQAALKHIAAYGQIAPLTPFYVGQYVLEIVFHFFTGWDFSIIERWFMPAAFAILIFLAGRYFLKKNMPAAPAGIIPIAVLFMIPSQFIYTSPYAFALLWAVIAVAALHAYFAGRRRSDYLFAGTAAAGRDGSARQSSSGGLLQRHLWSDSRNQGTMGRLLGHRQWPPASRSVADGGKVCPPGI